MFVDKLPVRLIKHGLSKGLQPIHIQVEPIDKTNNLMLSLDEIYKICDTFKHLGTEAVTLCGEPTCHPSFNSIVNTFALNGIKVGVETNGLTPIDNDNITWLRISVTPNLTLRHIVGLAANLQKTDIGIRYDLDTTSDVKFAMELVRAANQLKQITYVHLLSDEEHSYLVNHFRATINGYNTKCIFQVQSVDKGDDKCRMGLLKPCIWADGNIYPCDKCNVPLGKWYEYPSMVEYNGEGCKACPYDEYNMVLDVFETQTKYREFV